MMFSSIYQFFKAALTTCRMCCSLCKTFLRGFLEEVLNVISPSHDAVEVELKSAAVMEKAVEVNEKSSVVEMDQNGLVVAVDAPRIKEEEIRSVVAS